MWRHNKKVSFFLYMRGHNDNRAHALRSFVRAYHLWVLFVRCCIKGRIMKERLHVIGHSGLVSTIGGIPMLNITVKRELVTFKKTSFGKVRISFKNG